MLAAVASLIVAGSAESRDIYVRKTGHDLIGLGTKALPFLTLGRAGATLLPGDRVFVGPGVYVEKLSVSRSLLWASPALWIAEATGTVTIEAKDAGTPALFVSGSAGHTFRGFTFKPHAAGIATDATVVIADSSGVILEDCVCVGGRWGVVLRESTADLLDYEYSGSGDGVYCFESSSLTATGCGISIADASRSGFVADDSRLTLTRCEVVGGQCGVRCEGGPGAELTDCNVTGAVFGCVMSGESTVILRCDLLRCETGLCLPARDGPPPEVRESVITDGAIGISTARAGPDPAVSEDHRAILRGFPRGEVRAGLPARRRRHGVRLRQHVRTGLGRRSGHAAVPNDRPAGLERQPSSSQNGSYRRCGR